MANERIDKQLSFIIEADGLKQVFRQTLLLGDNRRENDAEHSWHLALMALLLAEHAYNPALDLLKVLKMILIHDLVEIDAGDTFAYDVAAQGDKLERERAAAIRLFGLLPSDQGAELRAIWDEFEAHESAEARFASALDRLQPLLLNYSTGGATWRKHGISKNQVIGRIDRIEQTSPTLWHYARSIIDKAVEKGYLAP